MSRPLIRPDAERNGRWLRDEDGWSYASAMDAFYGTERDGPKIDVRPSWWRVWQDDLGWGEVG